MPEKESMPKIRLDQLLIDRGLEESRTRAQRLVMAGQVRVNGQVMLKPSSLVLVSDEIAIEKGEKYVSRGGFKLEAALQSFHLTELDGWICADVGASTGGFTDCLLQHGARRVYALDVGYGLLHWKLRQDARVVCMERTNARFVQKLPEPVQLAVVDSSFISLRVLLPVILQWLDSPAGKVVALIKPQFEAGRAEAARGEGVVRDPTVHRMVVLEVGQFAMRLGFHVHGLIRSPLLGPKGNTEFLIHLELSDQGSSDLNTLVAGVFS